MLPAGRRLHPTSLRKACVRRSFLIWRHHETAFSDVRRRRYFTEARSVPVSDRPLEHAGLNLRDGNLEFVHRLANRFASARPAVVELALLGDRSRMRGSGVA